MNWSDIEALPPALSAVVHDHFKEGHLDEEVAMHLICDHIGIPYLDLIPSQVDLKVVERMGMRVCQSLGCLPIFRHGTVLVCAMRHPWSGVERAKIQQLNYDEVRVIGTSDSRMKQVFIELENLATAEDKKPKVVVVPPIKAIHGWGKGNDLELAQDIIRNAFYEGASDVHFEPSPHRLIIRFRINGVMVPQNPIEERFMMAVMDRVKSLAGVPTSDKKTLKDGRFSVALTRDKSIDLRFVALPALGNMEGVVLRILDPDSIRRNTGRLPFVPRHKDLFLERINAESGMIVITGPTGSGKTTTLYTALTSLNLPELKVWTVEDPIEYKLEKISQIQVDRASEVTFASSLRTILRADPDVIMVGEIRDEETAKLAAGAANTGHVVLATLHTNDALSVVPRLISLSLSHQDVQEVLTLAIAQRLVPTLCPLCKASHPITDTARELFDRFKSRYGLVTPEQIADSAGCHHCHNTGIQGRAPIFQFFDVNDEMRRMIGAQADVMQMREANAKYNPNLLVDALFKVAERVTPFSAALAYEHL